MADDDDTADDFVEEIDEEEIDEEVLDEEVLDDELADDLVEGDEGFEADAAEVAEEDEEEEAAAEPVARRKKGDDETEEDEDEFDPDDVEADLDTILKDRIAATDDEPDDEDELEQVDTRGPADTPDGVTPKRANEFMCTGCFLLVNPAQFGRLDNPRCPVGEEDCPAIRELTGSRKR